MRATIKDIARELQLAISTVSRALNGSYGVHPDTVQRVRQKAAELGYVPDLGAQQLAGKRGNMIGVFIPEFEIEVTPEFAEFFPPMHRALRAYGKDVLVISVPIGSYDKGKLEEWVALRNLTGMIVMPGFGREHPLLQEALRLRLPCVNFGGVKGERCSSFTSGDLIGGRAAGTYLAEKGHRKIGIISGPPQLGICQHRQRGFEQGFLSAAGAEQQGADFYVAHGDFSGASGGRAALELWNNSVGAAGADGTNEGITALFCMNDLMAMGAIAALSEAGVRIPEQLSVVGYDGAFFTAYMNPPLTTIRHPFERASERAAELLLELLNGGEGIIDDSLAPQLIERRTVSHPPSVLPPA